jgi:phytoene desaturase
MKKKIVVIGSGFGGLGAAIRLAAMGHDVEIFEKRDKIGGRAYQYEINGFKFDGGPTVLTAPYMFDELFELVGKRKEDYMTLIPLDPFYRVFNGQGQPFNYRHTLEDTLVEIDKWNPSDKDGYLKLYDQTKKLFDGFKDLTDVPFLKFSDMLKIIPDIIRLQGIWGTYPFASRYIKDEFLRKVFSFHPLLIGGSPLDTPSIFTIIVQFEKMWGVHYGKGGTGAVVQGLGKLFNEIGGKVHLNTEVKEIIVNDRKVKGIKLADGEKVDADIVVSNGDVAFTYKNLIPSEHRHYWTDRKLDRTKYSMSLMVIYFGTKRRYLDSKLHHHNIMLGDNYRQQLTEIFEGTELPKDLSLYLHMPSITDPTICPPGTESFYVLACVPHLRPGANWEEWALPYKERILQYLEENYLPDLRSNIIAEHYIDPLHFQNVLNSYKGAAFGVRPVLLQVAWFRPHNRSEEFDNLYFVGAGTHPGAGVPAVLSSGKIAANLIKEQLEIT